MERLLADADWVARSRAEPTAFGALYDRHRLAVARYVARRVGLEAAEDLTAEVFVRGFRGRERCRCENGSALPWLLGVANHVIADHRRAERRRLAALEQLARDERELVEHSDGALAPELLGALRRMPTVERDALLLVVWGELSYEEAARALDVPVGTLRSRIFRARNRLAQGLDPRRCTAPVRLRLRGQADA